MSLENDAANGAAGSAAAEGSAANGAAPSMDETLSNAYRAAMAKTEGDEEGGEATEAIAPTQDGRARGPDGKFVASQAKAEAAQPAAATETVEQPATEPKPHDAAPNTWKKELATEFGKLPENVREEIHRREADFHRGIGQYKQAAGFGTEMAQELLPYQATMQQHGKHPREVIKEATAVWNTLVTGTPQEKANLWLQVAKDYGINLSPQDSNAPQRENSPVQEDPRLATALQRLEKLEGTLTSQERQRAEAEYSQNVDQVQKFGADPKHKHFAAVREHMAALIESGQATDLKDAYDKAIWINPDVRKLLLAEQEKERADKAAADAAAARKAAGANVTRRGTPPVPQKTGRIEDTITSRYRELMRS